MEEDLKITSGYSKVLGDLSDKEMIAKLSFELGKYQEKSKEDEAVIEEMAEYIIQQDTFIDRQGYYSEFVLADKLYVINSFRNKVKENKE